VLLGFDDDVIRSRLGERIARDDIKTILLPEFEVITNCFYCPAERELFWARSIYVGDSGLPERATPNTWHERDSLTMVLPDRDGRMLGYMSVDGPIDGQVPSIETLRQMQLFLNMVGLALANSRAHRTEVERRKLLEENARLQNEFFSMVSHEVRSPLAAIGGATSLLETHFETMGDDRRGELLGVLSSSTARLASIFEDFLLLSRMEAGSLGLRIESIAPIAVTEEAIARLRSEHPTRIFNLAYLDPIPAMLGDEGRTVQVLVNLLSNAVKYSYPGTPIHVEIKPGASTVTISVVNEGDGVPQAERGMLFTRFGRLTHDNGSTGLGLYICKELVTLMGGSISFESDPGRLTAFWFSLPLAT
jgi:signal transduction histidine kinase